MKFPCPECERLLAPDSDWEYCPYCGSLLHHASRVTEWKEVATYASFGAASFASDELIRHGIPTKVRAEASSVDSSLGGRPIHALDVSADAFDEASEILAELDRHAEDEEIEPDPEPNPIAKNMASVAVLTIVLVFLAGLALALVLGISSLFERDPFCG